MDTIKQKLYEENVLKLVSSYLSGKRWIWDLYETYEDAKQTLLLQIWKHLGRFDKNKGSFSTFVYMICDSLIQGDFKKAKARQKYCTIVNINEPDNDYLAEHITNSFDDKKQELFDEKILQSAEEKLTKEARLFYIDKIKQIDIAKKEHLAPETVCRIIKRQIKIFKENENIQSSF